MGESGPEEEILAGRYRIERVIGQGGMGVIVSAIDLTTNARVAVKLLIDGASAAATERFLREARSAERLKSRHVARVLDVGGIESGAPYIALEYLEGEDLDRLLRRRGPLPIADAVDYLLEACDAIAEAHSVGIIHRDLKPGNLFLASNEGGDGCIKVLDFGVSKEMNDVVDGEQGLTNTSDLLGSPLYMAPEQMRSARNVDARTDIWALGAILYQLVAGRVPFEASSLHQIILTIINADRVPAPSSFRPDLPGPLEAAILRCLERDRDHRFANIGALAAAIAPYGSERTRGLAAQLGRSPAAASQPAPTSGAAAPAKAIAPAIAATAPAKAIVPAPQTRREALALILAVGLAVVLALVGLGIAALSPP